MVRGNARELWHLLRFWVVCARVIAQDVMWQVRREREVYGQMQRARRGD